MQYQWEAARQAKSEGKIKRSQKEEWTPTFPAVMTWGTIVISTVMTWDTFFSSKISGNSKPLYTQAMILFFLSNYKHVSESSYLRVSYG